LSVLPVSGHIIKTDNTRRHHHESQKAIQEPLQKNLLQESKELCQSPLEALKHSHLVDMDGTVAEFCEIIAADKHLFSCEHRSNFPEYTSYTQKKLDLYDAVDQIIEIEKARRRSPIC